MDERILSQIDTKKNPTKEWFLSLLDRDAQVVYEEEHMHAVMQMLRFSRIKNRQEKIKEAQKEIERIKTEEEHDAEHYVAVTELLGRIERLKKEIDSFRPLFAEPYFARMDLIDPIEGYNSYYIGKRGDERLEIVDWRAPLARRYYQKSRVSFSINEYDYKTILRRALKTENGKVSDFKNEFLSVKEYLSEEEINGRDEEILFDPYLREIIKSRKDDPRIKDIIETIQEKQYEIITCPERENFVLQGVAGSGKTMIMLHRLSYLMYNNDEIRAKDVLMLTPSDSFNAFIDELSAVLELERVRTTTVHEYFLTVLKNEKIDLKEKIDYSLRESEAYLSYLYSPVFEKDVKKKLDKVYDSLYGLFSGEECKEYIDELCEHCKGQLAAYETVKNASLRVRRAVLGDIKEKKDGGLYYTRPFRGLMNCILEILDFFEGTLKSENAKNQTYFYRQLLSFYKSAAYAAKYTKKIAEQGVQSLEETAYSLEREIVDLKRYKQRIGSTEIYTYEDRIRAKEKLKKEACSVCEKVRSVAELGIAFTEFYAYLRGEKNFSAVGNGKDFVDVVRFFYKETVRKKKLEYGMEKGKLYPSDAYAICVLCSLLGKDLSPRHSFVFVDEGQDLSCGEYDLLRRINPSAAFNVFGDVAQNVTPYRGVGAWEKAFPNFKRFELTRNYRNTNNIVEFVSEKLGVEMLPMGFDGKDVKTISSKRLNAFFKDTKGLKAIICSEKDKEEHVKKSYRVLSQKGTLSQTKINYMTVYESKGLEFASVAVYDENMTDAEKYIAYTRALKELALVR